ncbi:MAG: hypothetical protein PHY46_04390, partial [Candidatus Omnitrophica bacterium]|nr:hypothetical protein [Candidatus Omnitrophota bacterium]
RLQQIENRLNSAVDNQSRFSIISEIITVQAELASFQAELQHVQQEWYGLTNKLWTSTGFLEKYLKDNTGRQFNLTQFNAAARLEVVNALYRSHILSILRLLMPQAQAKLNSEIRPLLDGIGFTTVEEAINPEVITKKNQEVLKIIKPIILSMRNQEGGIKDRKERKKIPVLGQLPWLGNKLTFGKTKNEAQLRSIIFENILSGRVDLQARKKNFFRDIAKNIDLEVGLTTQPAPIVGARINVVNKNMNGPVSGVPEVINAAELRLDAQYREEVQAITSKIVSDPQTNVPTVQDYMNLAGGTTIDQANRAIQKVEQPKLNKPTVNPEAGIVITVGVDTLLERSTNLRMADEIDALRRLKKEVLRNRGRGLRISMSVNVIGSFNWITLPLGISWIREDKAKQADAFNQQFIQFIESELVLSQTKNDLEVLYALSDYYSATQPAEKALALANVRRLVNIGEESLPAITIAELAQRIQVLEEKMESDTELVLNKIIVYYSAGVEFYKNFKGQKSDNLLSLALKPMAKMTTVFSHKKNNKENYRNTPYYQTSQDFAEALKKAEQGLADFKASKEKRQQARQKQWQLWVAVSRQQLPEEVINSSLSIGLTSGAQAYQMSSTTAKSSTFMRSTNSSYPFLTTGGIKNYFTTTAKEGKMRGNITVANNQENTTMLLGLGMQPFDKTSLNGNYSDNGGGFNITQGIKNTSFFGRFNDSNNSHSTFGLGLRTADLAKSNLSVYYYNQNNSMRVDAGRRFGSLDANFGVYNADNYRRPTFDFSFGSTSKNTFWRINTYGNGGDYASYNVSIGKQKLGTLQAGYSMYGGAQIGHQYSGRSASFNVAYQEKIGPMVTPAYRFNDGTFISATMSRNWLGLGLYDRWANGASMNWAKGDIFVRVQVGDVSVDLGNSAWGFYFNIDPGLQTAVNLEHHAHKGNSSANQATQQQTKEATARAEQKITQLNNTVTTTISPYLQGARTRQYMDKIAGTYGMRLDELLTVIKTNGPPQEAVALEAKLNLAENAVSGLVSQIATWKAIYNKHQPYARPFGPLTSDLLHNDSTPATELEEILDFLSRQETRNFYNLGQDFPKDANTGNYTKEVFDWAGGITAYIGSGATWATVDAYVSDLVTYVEPFDILTVADLWGLSTYGSAIDTRWNGSQLARATDILWYYGFMVKAGKINVTDIDTGSEITITLSIRPTVAEALASIQAQKDLRDSGLGNYISSLFGLNASYGDDSVEARVVRQIYSNFAKSILIGQIITYDIDTGVETEVSTNLLTVQDVINSLTKQQELKAAGLDTYISSIFGINAPYRGASDSKFTRQIYANFAESIITGKSRVIDIDTGVETEVSTNLLTVQDVINSLTKQQELKAAGLDTYISSIFGINAPYRGASDSKFTR